MSEQKNSPATVAVVVLLCVIAVAMFVAFFVVPAGQGNVPGPAWCTPIVVGGITMCT